MKAHPRWQEIKYTRNGRAWVRHFNYRIYLDEVMRVEGQDKIGNFNVHGSFGLSNTSALVFEIDSTGEQVRIMRI
jgi:hypothetical protein